MWKSRLSGSEAFAEVRPFRLKYPLVTNNRLTLSEEELRIVRSVSCRIVALSAFSGSLALNAGSLHGSCRWRLQLSNIGHQERDPTFS